MSTINDYLSKIKEALTSDNFTELDKLLEAAIDGEISIDDREEIDDILNEVTLYLELKEAEYKEEGLKLIEEYK
jgi:hypothetical protein